MSRDEDIADLFRTYAAAWEFADVDALLDHFAVPQLLVGGGGTTFIEDAAALAEAIEADLAMWRARGQGKVIATVTSLTELPDDAVRAFVDWHVEEPGGTPGVRFAAIYTLVETGGAWLIVTSDLSDQHRAVAGSAVN